MRSDKGGENIDVARAMIAMRGTGRRSHITGSSVHNQRIERLWRDTFRCVGQLYYGIFYDMEECDLLDPTLDEDLFALHYVFLPRINHQLTQFANAWNHHPLRSENSLSPLQLWNRGLLTGSEEVQSEICQGLQMVDDDYGVDDYVGSLNSADHERNTNIVNVPEIDVNLTDSQYTHMHENFNPLNQSDEHGVDIYIQLKDFIYEAVPEDED